MAGADIQYVSDEGGEPTAVIVPISLWREIESERETANLLKSETMKRRLLEARGRQQGLSFDEAVEKPRRVTRLMMPVMPSASEISSRSRPENSLTSPEGKTARALTTLSTNQPYW